MTRRSHRCAKPIGRGSAMTCIAQTLIRQYGWSISREHAVAIPSRNHAPYPHGHRWRPPDAKPADRTTLPALQTALPRFITRQKASWLPRSWRRCRRETGSTGRVCHCFVSDSSYRDAGYLIVLCSGRLEQLKPPRSERRKPRLGPFGTLVHGWVEEKSPWLEAGERR